MQTCRYMNIHHIYMQTEHYPQNPKSFYSLEFNPKNKMSKIMKEIGLLQYYLAFGDIQSQPKHLQKFILEIKHVL